MNFGAVTLFLAGLFLGGIIRTAIPPAPPAPAAGFAQPRARDQALAKPSEILLAGAERDNSLHLQLSDQGSRNRYALGPFVLEHPPAEEAHAREAAYAFLGAKNKRSFLGRAVLYGVPVEAIFELKRNPSEPSGAEARLLRTEHRPDGTHYDQSLSNFNSFVNYNSAQNAVIFAHDFPDARQHSLFEEPHLEFPLRPENKYARPPGTKFRSRYFALDLDQLDFAVVSTVEWQELSEQAATAYVQKYSDAWAHADSVRRGPYRASWNGQPPRPKF